MIMGTRTVPGRSLSVLGVMVFLVLIGGVAAPVALCDPVLSSNVDTLDSTGISTSGQSNYTSRVGP